MVWGRFVYATKFDFDSPDLNLERNSCRKLLPVQRSRKAFKACLSIQVLFLQTCFPRSAFGLAGGGQESFFPCEILRDIQAKTAWVDSPCADCPGFLVPGAALPGFIQEAQSVRLGYHLLHAPLRANSWICCPQLPCHQRKSENSRRLCLSEILCWKGFPGKFRRLWKIIPRFSGSTKCYPCEGLGTFRQRKWLLENRPRLRERCWIFSSRDRHSLLEFF